jgi:hypothetical protein
LEKVEEVFTATAAGAAGAQPAFIRPAARIVPGACNLGSSCCGWASAQRSLISSARRVRPCGPAIWSLRRAVLRRLAGGRIMSRHCPTWRRYRWDRRSPRRNKATT